jgi:hypothetical protein
MSEQSGYLTAVHDACHAVGPKAAVVVLASRTNPSPDVSERWIPPALRSWCGIPVATVYSDFPTAPSTLARLAANWSTKHKDLFVMATSADPILQVMPNARLTPLKKVANNHLLEQTFTHRPWNYERQSFSMVVAPVPAPPIH